MTYSQVGERPTWCRASQGEQVVIGGLVIQDKSARKLVSNRGSVQPAWKAWQHFRPGRDSATNHLGRSAEGEPGAPYGVPAVGFHASRFALAFQALGPGTPCGGC